MLSRYFVSFNIAALITFGLFFAMQMLISNGEIVLTEEKKRIPIILNKVRPVEERIDRIEQPELIEVDYPPAIQRKTSETNDDGPILVTVSDSDINKGPEPMSSDRDFTIVDGIHIPIVRAVPQYPVRLQEQGIEGFVGVQFDITAAGNTENVIAIESSHPGFERSAIRAVQKFKFKPKVVDGIPVRVTGVLNRMDFKLQD